MVRQVFLKEMIPLGSPGLYQNVDTLTYGAHPDASTGMKHPAVRAAALAREQSIRVVMDELLVGNYLEKIACRGEIDVGEGYSLVPPGTTPDDIAACSVAADVLPESCTGEHAVCIDRRNAPPCTGGCGPGTTCVDDLCVRPVGVLDERPEGGDGAADDTRMIDGAVGLRCGSIDVPIDVDGSYWQPSGNQQVPATGGLLAIGPAVILRPIDGLPTGRTCSIVFSPDVVDKGGNQVCAPQYGAAGAPEDSAWPPVAPCTPGDTSDIQFTVEPLELIGGATVTQSPMEGEVGYPTASPIAIFFNAKMDPASFADVSFTPAPPMPPVVTRGGAAQNEITITVPGGLAPNTTYTFSAPSAADVFGGGLATPFEVTFTTGT